MSSFIRSYLPRSYRLSNTSTSQSLVMDKYGSGFGAIGNVILCCFLVSSCEPLDQKHTDRVFPLSACEPLDQKHTDRVFCSSYCEPFD